MISPHLDPQSSKRPRDLNQLAKWLVDAGSFPRSSRELPRPRPARQPLAVIGRKGSQIGGKRRLATMTREQWSSGCKR